VRIVFGGLDAESTGLEIRRVGSEVRGEKGAFLGRGQ